jgi:hypothetical protein
MELFILFPHSDGASEWVVTLLGTSRQVGWLCRRSEEAKIADP